jgi:hypothetical protein
MTRGYCRQNEVVVINIDLRLTKLLSSDPREIANRVFKALLVGQWSIPKSGDFRRRRRAIRLTFGRSASRKVPPLTIILTLGCCLF